MKPLQSKFHGPYVVKEKRSYVNYVIKTPDRRKSERLIHINHLKLYHVRETDPKFPVQTVTNYEVPIEQDDINFTSDTKLQNSDIMTNPSLKLQHLPPDKSQQLEKLFFEYPQLFCDVPQRCPMVEHDVALVDGARSTKQHHYQTGPWRRDA